MSISISSTRQCKAVVLKASYHVVVEDRPYPHLRSPDEAVIKTLYSGLCGESGGVT